jgi:DNA mismatch endonuclease, patch repair protein
MDRISKAERSWVMSRVGSSGTGAELHVRSLLRESGLRFSTNFKALPGTPDIVFLRLKIAVFVNGCFWHSHGCSRSKMPASNQEYWTRKIERNVNRDRSTRRRLNLLGWHCFTLWECSLERGVRRILRLIERLQAS